MREWSKDLRALEQVERQTLEDNERWFVSNDGCWRVGKKQKSVALLETIHNWDRIVFPGHRLKGLVGLPIVRMPNSEVRIYTG